MSTTTTNQTAAPATPVRSIQLPCPQCGEAQANISLGLADFGLTCHECDAEFTIEEVRGFIARWTPVIRWLDDAPVIE
jgi:hypothetical protein